MRSGRRLRVRVPATSANLGCGFDCVALALSLYLDTEISPRNDKKITVRYSGPTPDRVPQDGSNLIAQVIQDELTRQGKSQGFDLTIENQIPIGVGLGSSAAAIVAGLALSSRLAGREIEESELVRRAVEREGHPDNVAAAWHGGFVLAVSREGGIFTRSVPIPENLQLVLVIPDRVLPTEEARRILPEKLTRADAVHNLQRATALAAEFFSGKPQLESFLFDDRWHQPYRARLVPGLDDALALRHPDLAGVCLSGAGSSVLAFTRARTEEIAKRLAACFEKLDIRTDTRILAADNRGARGWLSEA